MISSNRNLSLLARLSHRIFSAVFILMEKELLAAFEAAEKAAEAAAADGGLAEEDRCLDALKRLRRMPVTTKDLVNTQVGKRIRSLTKHPKPRIQSVATDLFKFWKSVVIEETNRDSKKSSTSVDVNLAKNRNSA
ncbi:hypothetical protein M5K25_022956 [Dendrobium thyrsiflorum]|uniref:TFIIS N-terminal domain-containing protein n=1 Tax=Dendrobium thyrsiflorum TaxID=117978 RepID=A0ABD0U784_DENTH